MGHHPHAPGNRGGHGTPAAGDLRGIPAHQRHHLSLRRLSMLLDCQQESERTLQPTPGTQRRLGHHHRSLVDHRLSGMDRMVLVGRTPSHERRHPPIGQGGQRRRGLRKCPDRNRGGTGTQPGRSLDGRRRSGHQRHGHYHASRTRPRILLAGPRLEAQRGPGPGLVLRGHDPHRVGDPAHTTRKRRRRCEYPQRGQSHRGTGQHGHSGNLPVAGPVDVCLDAGGAPALSGSGFLVAVRCTTLHYTTI
mmetsp:Transcript_22352/g.48603  ORF Transcript_22352/g.48603 Transcript_22352/m.48603 type:complete len:248 (+) Transcript_22352:548-1291(+)